MDGRDVKVATLAAFCAVRCIFKSSRKTKHSRIPKEIKNYEFVDDVDFSISPQLLEGKHEVARLALCTVLVCDDQRFPWLVLVPRQAHAVEILDLSAEKQRMLWTEVGKACKIVQGLTGVKKLNVATLGNVCSQLHIHVTGRHHGDAAWPGPCYGVGTAVPYSEAEGHPWLEKWRDNFDTVPHLSVYGVEAAVPQSADQFNKRLEMLL